MYLIQFCTFWTLPYVCFFLCLLNWICIFHGGFQSIGPQFLVPNLGTNELNLCVVCCGFAGYEYWLLVLSKILLVRLCLIKKCVVEFRNKTKLRFYLNNYFRLHVCLSFCCLFICPFVCHTLRFTIAAVVSQNVNHKGYLLGMCLELEIYILDHPQIK